MITPDPDTQSSGRDASNAWSRVYAKECDRIHCDMVLASRLFEEAVSRTVGFKGITSSELIDESGGSGIINLPGEDIWKGKGVLFLFDDHRELDIKWFSRRHFHLTP